MIPSTPTPEIRSSVVSKIVGLKKSFTKFDFVLVFYFCQKQVQFPLQGFICCLTGNQITYLHVQPPKKSLVARMTYSFRVSSKRAEAFRHLYLQNPHRRVFSAP